MTLTEMLDNNMSAIENKIKEKFPFGFSSETEISVETKEKFLEFVEENKEKYKNDSKPKLSMLQDYLFENDFFMENEDYFYNEVRDTIENFLKDLYNEEYEVAYENATYDEIEYFQEIYQNLTTIDYNFENILNDIKIDEVVIFVTPNGEDVEDSFRDFKIFENNNGVLSPSNFSETTLEEALLELEDENERPNPLNWLIQTQGYELTDLYDNSKVQNSTFLKSLKTEICDYEDDLSGNLAFRFPEVPFNEVFEFEDNNTNLFVKASDNIEVGIFNCVYGSGSGMQIELEKDLVIPKEFIQVSRTGKSIGYMPADVYGYMEGETSLRKTEEPTIKLKEINKEVLKEIAHNREFELNKIEKVSKILNTEYKSNSFATEAVPSLGTEPFLQIDDAYEGNYGNLKEAVNKIDNFEHNVNNVLYFGEGFEVFSAKGKENPEIKITLQKIVKPSDIIAIGELSKESSTKFEIKSRDYNNKFTATINNGNINIESKKEIYPVNKENFALEIAKDFNGKITLDGKEFNPDITNQKNEQKKANSLIRN